MKLVTRRDAIKLIAVAPTAAAASSVVACSKPIAPQPDQSGEQREHSSVTTRATRADQKPTPEKTVTDAPENYVLASEPLGFLWKTRDPFLFCAHHDDRYPAGNAQLGPAAPLTGRNLGQDFEIRDGWRMYHGDVVPGFPRHPHRGFETVSIVRSGLMDHSDSLGAGARFGGGDVQWLTAGKGINHAEMFPLLDSSGPNPLELFQVWLNLPRADKMVEPYFTMLWKENIERVSAEDEAGRRTDVTVIAGTLGETKGPPPPPDSYASKADHDVGIWTLKMQPGAQWTLPAARPGTDRTLYVFHGAGLTAGEVKLPVGHQFQVRAEANVLLTNGSEETEILLLQGQPIGEPVAHHGPFVMNTPEEIRQAYADYRQTQFGGWPWPGDDPVHGAKQGRFARHADGHTEEPA